MVGHRSKARVGLAAALALAAVACAQAPSADRLSGYARDRNSCDPSDPACGDDGSDQGPSDDSNAPNAPRPPRESADGGAVRGATDAATVHHDGAVATDAFATTADVHPAATGECGGQATAQACYTCCDNKHTAASQTWWGAWGDCACSPTQCANECGAWCAGQEQQADATCQSCLDRISQVGQCDAYADGQCRAAGTSCTIVLDCATQSSCATKS